VALPAMPKLTYATRQAILSMLGNFSPKPKGMRRTA